MEPSATDRGYVPTHKARPPPARRARHAQGQALRLHQPEEEPHRVPRLLLVPPRPLPTRDTHRDRHGRLHPHLSTKKDLRVGEWAWANNVELRMSRPSSWRVAHAADQRFLPQPDREPVPRWRYFALNGADHEGHDVRNGLLAAALSGLTGTPVASVTVHDDTSSACGHTSAVASGAAASGGGRGHALGQNSGHGDGVTRPCVWSRVVTSIAEGGLCEQAH